MSKHSDNLYIINWKEGGRGSFIGDLVLLLLTDNTSTIIPVKKGFGDGGRVSRGWVTRNVNYPNSSEPYPERYFELSLADSCDDDFILVQGHPTDQLGWDRITTKYKNWKAMWIVFEPHEKIIVDMLHLYKCFDRVPPYATDDYFIDFYKSHPDLRIDGIDHPKHMTEQQLSNFMNIYMEENAQHFTIYEPAGFQSMLDTVPQEEQHRIYKLNFMDITTNMDKVLTILSDFTGKKITNNIVQSYTKYLLHQQLPQKYLEVIKLHLYKKIQLYRNKR